MKECILTWGYLALCLKGRRSQDRSEKSAEAIVVRGETHYGRRPKAKGRRNGRCSLRALERVMLQMFTKMKLVTTVDAGESCATVAASETILANPLKRNQACCWSANFSMTSTISTARCGPACRVVWQGSTSASGDFPNALLERCNRLGSHRNFDRFS